MFAEALLSQLVVEIKKLNVQLELITDHQINESDIN